MEARVSIITLGGLELERSYRFYHEGLGLLTTKKPEDGIIFFQTSGTCLALYPLDKLAEDVSPSYPVDRGGFSGITLAYNAKSKEEVKITLALAEGCGGKIQEPAQDVSWVVTVATFLTLMVTCGK